MPKIKQEYCALKLFRSFINDMKKGKHVQKNGARIKRSSIENYEYLEALLTKFSENKRFNIRLKNCARLTKKQFSDEKKYWKGFYFQFTNFLYDDLGHFDNYVGRMMKLLRSFFNYLNHEKGMNIGFFHRKFYAPIEDVEIHVLSPERLNLLIDDQSKELSLTKEMRDVKDVFVFGTAVGLRFSDLMALKKPNLEVINNRFYLNVLSKKTQAFTKVKLPDFAVNILLKHQNFKHKLLPSFNKVYMNKYIKKVMEHYEFTEPVFRTRRKRGLPVITYKGNDGRSPYRFCDVVTTHTMRRTAITTMLSLGMNEQAVRQISGHAANSKEFFRYVAFAQTYVDDEIDTVHQKLKERKMIQKV